jgi:hypothetical protein
MTSAPTHDPERSAPDPLFREEAMREYAHGRLEGKLLRISPGWADWVFWLLMATFAATAAFLFLAQIDHVVSGPALVRRAPVSSGGENLEVVALLPGNARAQIDVHQTMSVRWDGAAVPALDLEVQDIAPEIVGPDRARALLGNELSGIVDVSGPVVFVRAPIPASATASSSHLVPGASGIAEVRIGRHRLYEELLPGLRR